jgi:hypothetical protein
LSGCTRLQGEISRAAVKLAADAPRSMKTRTIRSLW